MPSSALTQKISIEIKQRIQLGELEVGAHLSCPKLAEEFEVSRSPAREALRMLEDAGYLKNIPGRGFFVIDKPDESFENLDQVVSLEEPEAYYQLADDWVNNNIASDVTEQMIRNRYCLTKVQVIDILNRAAQAGWAERKPGYGWRFLEITKTPDTLEKIYRARALIESAAILEDSFNYDFDLLKALKKEQQDLLDGDIEKLPADALIRAGIRFHEEFIKLSGNKIYHMMLAQLNKMRKLLEHRSMIDRKRLYRQCEEHIQMIEMIEDGNNLEAALLMKKHLSGSFAVKSPILNLCENEFSSSESEEASIDKAC